MRGNWGLIGHEWAVNLLRGRLASQRLGHAYLITGPPSIGKTTLASRLAQAINCQNPDQAPCGQCRACQLIERRIHPDLEVLGDDGVNIKIDAIRDLQANLARRPFEAPYRIALVLNLHNASLASADALLKTLEEPPAEVKLILTADNAELLLPTIVSRCQVLPLRPVPLRNIEMALVQEYDIPPDQAVLLARLSGGRPGWAISHAQDEDQMAWRGEVLNSIIDALRSTYTQRFSLAEAIARDNQRDRILELWLSWWRDVVLLANETRVPPVNMDRAADLDEVAYRIDPDDALIALKAVRRTTEALGRYANARLALEVMMLDLPRL
ncbi:MAG: DNA polymerase III subunit [Chloroflexi bacterium]|nr:DNA polymerase III subunit [Chloroflexota bacterium]